MDAHHHFDTIDLATFRAVLEDYAAAVPESLASLEQQRVVIIPAAVQSRDPQHLTKEELTLLMDWKLAHGKFRAQLQKLIQQNEGVTVKSATIEAYRMPLDSIAEVQKAMSTLSTLRGVGPATASLLLSVKDQANIPFFSDELYCWALWKTGSSGGWSQEIKYSEKSYLELYPRVQELRERLKGDDGEPVSVLEIEKVAYALRAKGGAARPRAKAKPKKATTLKRKAETQHQADEKNEAPTTSGGGAEKTGASPEASVSRKKSKKRKANVA
ncbi:hypothetical protein LTS10_011336 [Elasticomyces elasticus]|nr:hypothetical protein LTS10_011336 [Elasticomyces elasticus]